ncbi:UDP-N-acetylglucosamine 2-epimerase (non-hydrolyzing) [Pseudoduganella sp. FT26W]|uniref:UDP-N-acetylglucosamine 2-epimerase (non-hydrolyzing) n=1 Tax=Duganella aquatilis TaxID=2666082 RepID=A0A844D5T0_9BURK|nr:UDP-N-acetylglucosamine 2-epimerase (non-hydrolyzing) [Duganella aquatilis]MRW82860.1 UDP-N-acetylglucosamine 2-epimerase (non-hydrolyzing) [Duganella aquatilis]
MKILSIFGTRPEAIKMAPVVRALASADDIESVVCVTGQHKSMLDQVMHLFDITAQHNLEVMQPEQTLNSLSARLFEKLGPVLEAERPDRVLVHGDTTTAAIAAMAAFHQRIPVAHIEAGLRTGNMQQPWPEEMNRRNIDVMGDYLFAPTAGAAENLRNENLAGRIIVTGNTVIDALQLTVQRIRSDVALQQLLDAEFPFLADARRAGRKLLLVTGHRRENFGAGFAGICQALAQLSERDDIEIVYPVHLNPQVLGPVKAMLSGRDNVHLIAPLDYLHFVRLMQHAHVVLTDSGGVQEEAPALGKPVLVMRDVTERPEAVASGTVRLVGTVPARIVANVAELFDNAAVHAGFARKANPYGDGRSAQRIVAALTGVPFTEFSSPAGASVVGHARA